MAMADGDGGLDSAARRLNRAHGVAAWVRGEAREVGARRIEAGRRGTVGATLTAQLCSSSTRPAREEGEGKGKMDDARAQDKDSSRGGRGSSVRATHGGRRQCACHRHGLAYEHSAEQGNNSEWFD